jgi:hypothetical protein
MHGDLDHLRHLSSHQSTGISSRTESENNNIAQDGLFQVDNLYWSYQLLDDLLNGLS